MERCIINKLRESRTSYYRGYTVEEDNGDYTIIVKGKKLTFESEKEAHDYIDDIPSHNLTRSISQEYCIVIRYPNNPHEYYVGSRRGLVPVTGAKKSEIRLFPSKKDAEKVYNGKIKSALAKNSWGIPPYHNIKLYN